VAIAVGLSVVAAAVKKGEREHEADADPVIPEPCHAADSSRSSAPESIKHTGVDPQLFRALLSKPTTNSAELYANRTKYITEFVDGCGLVLCEHSDCTKGTHEKISRGSAICCPGCREVFY